LIEGLTTTTTTTTVVAASRARTVDAAILPEETRYPAIMEASGLILMWLLLITAISVAALVVSVMVWSRLPKHPASRSPFLPQQQSQFLPVPPAFTSAQRQSPVPPVPPTFAPPQGGFPHGPASVDEPTVVRDLPETTWVPRSRCAELNITD